MPEYVKIIWIGFLSFIPLTFFLVFIICMIKTKSLPAIVREGNLFPYCKFCGKKLKEHEFICPYCNNQTRFFNEEDYIAPEKKKYSLLLDILMTCLTYGLWLVFVFLRPKYEFPLWKLKLDDGKKGENIIYAIIENNLKDIPHKTLKNLYMPYGKNKTTEIDLLLITDSGLYVFESKYYSSWIYGNEEDKYWTQTFRNGYKTKFYNPIKQNKTHISVLRNNLKEHFKTLPIRSYVIFSNAVTFKTFDIDSYNDKSSNKIYLMNELEDYLEEDILDTDEVLTESEIESIYNLLLPYSNVSDEVKEQHIKDIEDKYRKS